MQHYTTIEQSKKLVELDLNPKTADMCYIQHFGESYIENPILMSTIDTINLPCWSLGALMNLLPPSIKTGEGTQPQYEIAIRKYHGEDELYLYQIAYGNDKGLSEEWHDMINTGEKENLTDVAFQMICWLLKNGYIQKGE